jgi:transcriptional regulator with XRE-family HTH domain
MGSASGKRLRETRLSEGLGVREMAKRLGTSPATLSRIERGFTTDTTTSATVSQNAGFCLCCGQEWPTNNGETP